MTVSSLELQQAGLSDLPGVVSLLNRAYRGSGDVSGWTTEVGLIDGDRDSEPLLEQEMASKPDARLLVWKPHGEVNGCVWLEPAEDGQWYLGSLAVEPSMQNGRVGRRMLIAAEQAVRGRGGRAIKMTVIDSRDELVAWYERRGYRKTGETVPFPYSESRFGVPRETDVRFCVLVKQLL